MNKPKRGPPPKVSVWKRWFLPDKERHIAIPFSVLTSITAQENLGAEELRVLLWLLADWWWPGGLVREINTGVLSDRASTHRQNVHRALSDLERHGMIEVFRKGHGRRPSVSIEPLVRLARLVASKEASGGYSRQGHGRKKHQVDASKHQVDASSSIKREPAVGTSDPSSSDPTNAVVGDARAGFSPVASPPQPHEALRRAQLLDQIKRLEDNDRAAGASA